MNSNRTHTESKPNSRNSQRLRANTGNQEQIFQRYDNMAQGVEMEEKLNEVTPKISLQALPLRSYLDQTCTQTLINALKELDKQRPADPVEFFAYYILASKKQQQ